MNRRRDRNTSGFSRGSVLISESAEDFESFCAELEEEIKPRGIIERIYVDDFANIVWEMQRLRRCKTGIINRAFRPALQSLILQALPRPERRIEDPILTLHSTVLAEESERQREADELVDAWFTNPTARKSVMSLLEKFNFDLTDVEASAVQIVSDDIEKIDRMLALLESRRNRALACVGEYRQTLSQQLSQSSDKVLKGKTVLRLEQVSKKTKTA
jgi:hypothetical protein